MTELKVDHKARISKLHEVFGRRQEIALNSGKKHDVSIAKICSDAKVDKTYLFGLRLKEDDPFRRDYLAIKEEILTFQKKLASGLEKSNHYKKSAEIEQKYKALLSDIEPLQRELAQLRSISAVDRSKIDDDRQRIIELLSLNSSLESKLLENSFSPSAGGSLISRTIKHVVSPDKFRIVGGKYRIQTEESELEAWSKAYLKLEELLSRNLKMRLYVLVGLPCSGKSTWAEEAVIITDRHPVIWDATNLRAIDRYRLIALISKFTDLPKTCVYFDTDFEVIRERNRTLRNADKQMSDKDLSLMRQKLEKPDPYNELWIDELTVVRRVND